jgi:peptidoglycan/xylan/chitin deacetylase (PgdA/CDA1 family)
MKLIRDNLFWIRKVYLQAHSILLGGAVTQGPLVNWVALTFDDGPDPRHTPQVLDILDTHQARATFFVIGERVEEFPDLAKEIATRGHELAVHLYSHDRAVARDDARFRTELTRTREAIKSATGAEPRYLRFPFAYLGHQKPSRITEEFGLQTVHWSFSSQDSRRDAQGILRRVRGALFPGAIVLLHDGIGGQSRYTKDRLATISALPGILTICRERGLLPVRLSDLLSR